MTVRDSFTSPGSQRTCPNCGHANSNISLFCAECGAVLNGAQDDERSTSAYSRPAIDTDAGVTMSATNDGQGTEPIRTTTAEQEWASMMSGSGDDANATAPLPRMDPPVSSVSPPEAAVPMSTEASGIPATWAAQSTPDAAVATLPTMGVTFGAEEAHRQSMRGFWFGVIGFLLILAVLGLYGWSVLPDGGFRDTVQGWF